MRYWEKLNKSKKNWNMGNLKIKVKMGELLIVNC